MTEGITLEDIIETIIESRRMLFAFFAIAVVMAYFFSWTTPKMYTAEATILPVTSGSGAGLANFLAGTGLGMLTNSETKANVILIAMSSQTLAENVLKKLDNDDLLLKKPKEKLKPNDLEKAANTLRANVVRSFVTKNGSIIISATMRDPVMAAKVVNTYLEELSLFFNQKGISMNFNIIDPAKPPGSPSNTNLMKKLVISLGIAFFFGLMYIGANVGVFKK